MRLVIQENADLVTDWAARYVLKRVKDFNPGPDNFFVLGLPTGNLYIYTYTIFLFISNLLVFIKRTNYIYYEIATELLLDHKNDNIF
jgi:hypothetical protein